MRNLPVSLSLVLVLVLAAVGGSAALVSARQLSQPGMSPARFWINNRTRDEAIPVNIVNTDPKALPLPVTMSGVATVSVSGLTPVTASRQMWEYREASFTPNQGMAAGLNTLGNDGWEVTGITTQPNGGVTVLLKRPR